MARSSTMKTLKNKSIVIIGGSSGIGRQVAEFASIEGAKLTIVGRNNDRLKETETALARNGAAVETIQCDAHDHQQLEILFSKLKPFDHLVSMVGDVMGGGFIGSELSEIRRVLESKFFTNVRIGQLAAEKVKEQGSLIFTSGTGGRAQDASGSYVGNLGINALVEGLAVELAPKVRVNAVSPTWTLTPFWRDLPTIQVEHIQNHFEQTIPLKRIAQIEELAMTYIFLMKNGFITGQHIAVDGGIMLGG